MKPPTTGQPTSADFSGNTRTLLLTVEEAARRLSIGRTTMYTLLKDGQVNSVRIGHLRRISTEALAAYISRLAAE